MNKEASSELGQLIVSQDKLLTVLAQNLEALDDYPHLQAYAGKKHPNMIAYNKLSKVQKQEFYETLDERLGWIAYELSQEVKLDFLVNRAALLVGDDLKKLSSLTIADIGADTIVKYLNLLASGVYAQVERKPSYPWMAEKGRWDPKFWANSHLAYDAWKTDYSSHYKLDMWCQDQLDCRAPQSCIKFFKAFGDPREIPEWSEKYEKK
ncbi:hypothetical protein [Psychromonas aquimarina]|uniref:hypothetical protein n=1 Tax=Psychromonas aquimarina TaxID=444919 RepID=UPI000427FFFB|nr:hypothetical protein [Psychromonas aquimarina]